MSTNDFLSKAERDQLTTLVFGAMPTLAPVSPECGPVPRAPGDTPLFYAKHIGGGDIIFCTSHGAAPDPVADGWHPFALLPDKP